MKLFIGLFFALTFLVVTVALLAGFVKHKSARFTVGDVIAAHGSRSSRRMALFAFLGLAFSGCMIVADVAPGSFKLAAAVSVIGALALVFLPIAEQGWIGTTGVRLGWLVLPWERVDSWRLVGEHLRFRHGERWLAIPVGASEMESVRRVLTAAIAERESELV